ncbi:recombinase family protein [Variovorax sp. 3P27G3]|uniref:recombinase family protein n=1 Tax=Variovorax sp. 3P27G3 TaxID=2502214 RepID=UPI0010F57E30|nr:recombinase family protein [Variovorax sp. 3P27G3]
MSGLVYSYSRFSDPRQAKGSSLERQAAYAARWAAEHGLKLDESLTLRDEGLSAYHQKHVKSGALGVFLAAIESGKVPPGSVLVVEGLDRLSRAEPIQAQGQLAQIVNAGITVVTASDGKAYSRERLKANPMDLVYSLLVMIRAHEESDTKSKRVRASIVRQCQNWLAGTYRGLIRNGKDPAWLELVDGKWEPIPERVEAVRVGLDLYRRGYSATRILTALTEQKLSLTGRGPQTLQIYRLIKQRALLGEKEIEVDGETFQLPGYYPALLTEAEWNDLQTLASGRGRRAAAGGSVPGIVTGLGITTCGYCGRALVGQNIGTRNRRPDGGILDGHRRLHCTSYSNGGCPVPGSSSVAPVERALMAYCSDMLNLQALYGGDRAAGPRARLAKARADLADLTAKLERLTDAMLEAAEDGGTPATFARRARALEVDQQSAAVDVATAERELASVARTDLQGADATWRKLAAGVEAQDADARIQARQLVADTFEQIIIYMRGARPAETPKGMMDIALLAKGGTYRTLRIDKQGNWIDAEEGVDDAA